MNDGEFKRALAQVVRIEGGYVDHPADRGGPTKLGVTLGTLRRWYAAASKPEPGVVELQALTLEDAETLYHDLYWSDRRLPCQRLADWWAPLGHEAFDTAVNSGPATSATLLQRALNLINLNERAWPDVTTDGWIGERTLALLPLVDTLARGRERLLYAVNAYQAKMFIEIAERDPTQEAFIGGWLMHRVQIGSHAVKDE